MKHCGPKQRLSSYIPQHPLQLQADTNLVLILSRCFSFSVALRNTKTSLTASDNFFSNVQQNFSLHPEKFSPTSNKNNSLHPTTFSPASKKKILTASDNPLSCCFEGVRCLPLSPRMVDGCFIRRQTKGRISCRKKLQWRTQRVEKKQKRSLINLISTGEALYNQSGGQ